MFKPAVAACCRISVMPPAKFAPAEVASLNDFLAFSISVPRYFNPSPTFSPASFDIYPNVASNPLTAKVRYFTTLPNGNIVVTTVSTAASPNDISETRFPVAVAALTDAAVYNSVPDVPACNPFANSIAASAVATAMFLRLTPKLTMAVLAFPSAAVFNKSALAPSADALFFDALSFSVCDAELFSTCILSSIALFN